MKSRAFFTLLVASLIPTRSPAEDLYVVLDDLEMDCRTLAEAEGGLLEEVAGEVEERLRWVDEAPTSDGELAEMLRNLPAWRPVVAGREHEVHGLVGDLFLFTGRLGPAMAAYGRAAEAGPVSSARCGMSYDGAVYTFEVVEIARPRESSYYLPAPYLLIRDPTTGHVLERILLPTLPSAMAIDGGDLRILFLSYWPRDVEGRPSLHSVGLAQLRRDPLEVPTDFVSARLRSRKGSQVLAVNFLWETKDEFSEKPNPDFTLRSDVVAGRPADLETLEAALRQAILEDPTQPWHLFLLGRCLWAQGRRVDAMDAWEDLLAGIYPGIPYYEYADMARYFELYRQLEWADAAFRAALERRRRLPLPVEWSYLIERLVNVPTRWPALEHDRWPERDVERAYLWWLRLREISGVSEGDDLRAVLWARYFKSVGDGERAAAELDYLDRLRRCPWLRPLDVYWDYTAWFLVASSAGFIFMLVVLVVTTAKRILPRPLSERHRAFKSRRRGTRLAWLRRSGIVLVPSLALGVNLMVLSFELHLFKELYSRPRVPADVSENRPHGIEDPGASFKAWIREESWRPWRVPYEVSSQLLRYRITEETRKVLDFAKATSGRITTFFAERNWLSIAVVGGVLVWLVRRFSWVVRWLVQVLMPGAVFLRRGQLIRAYFNVWLFFFASGPLLWIAWVRTTDPTAPRPGFISSIMRPGADDFALPGPQLDQLVAESFWSLLWVLPFARPFYALVAAALSTVLYLQCREPLKCAWAVFRRAWDAESLRTVKHGEGRSPTLNRHAP